MSRCRVTDEFLEFSKQTGNDLSTPMPEYGFAGLSDGDQVRVRRPLGRGARGRRTPARSCSSTHVSALEYVDLDDLKSHGHADVHARAWRAGHLANLGTQR